MRIKDLLKAKLFVGQDEDYAEIRRLGYSASGRYRPKWTNVTSKTYPLHLQTLKLR